MWLAMTGKMNKKAKLRAIAELKTSPYPNSLLNIYGQPRKLIIFDINKVLLFRQAKSSRYTLRPHAREFIESMSERFTLAVWTSMTKRFAVEILADLFPNHQAPLLFQWYQNRCRSVEAENKADKPIFLKELTKVWGEHKYYNETNTILIDDSIEKCVFNPPWTCIHPHPYDPYRPPSPTAPRPSARPGSRWGPVPTQVRSPAAVRGCGPTAGSHDSAVVDIDGDGDVVIAEGNFGAVDDLPQPAVVVMCDGDAAGTEPGEPETTGAENSVDGVAVAAAVSIDPARPPLPPRQLLIVDQADTAGGSVVESAHSGEPAHGLPPAPQSPHPYYSSSPSLPPPPPPPPPSTRPLRGQDDTLAVGGPLWTYLDRIAQYDGSIRDLYELCGPYK